MSSGHEARTLPLLGPPEAPESQPQMPPPPHLSGGSAIRQVCIPGRVLSPSCSSFSPSLLLLICRPLPVHQPRAGSFARMVCVYLSNLTELAPSQVLSVLQKLNIKIF